MWNCLQAAPSMLITVLAISLICCPQTAVAIKFLAVPLPSDNSPVLDLMGVASQLQSRGHQVYVIADDKGKAFAQLAAVRHSSNTTAEAMQYIPFAPKTEIHLDALIAEVAPEFKKTLERSKLAGLQLLFTLQKFLVKPCKALLEDAAAMKVLRSLNVDAILSFGPPSPVQDSCGCLLSHAYSDIPWIDVYGSPMVFAPFSVPQLTSGNRPEDVWTPRGFLKNLAPYLMLRALPVAIDITGNPWARARKELGLPAVHSNLPPVNLMSWILGHKRKSCEPLLQVQLNSWLMEHPRPLAANQVLVGPGTPRPAHPISPSEVAEFVDSAPAGVVLMAVGTTPQAQLSMTAKDIVELAEGFALLAPTRVLWAFKPQKHLPPGMKVEDVPRSDNVMLTPWVDYNDVLGHPNMRVLVSHCGWHSVYETAYHGVPVVGVPFQMEQAENVMKLSHRGMAVMMPHAPSERKGKEKNVTFDRQEVADTIKKVMNDPSYTSAARGMSHALRVYSKRRQPYARAADEVELAVYTQHAQLGRRQDEQVEPVSAEENETHQQDEL